MLYEMAWSTGFLIFLFVCNYFEPGTPALTKAGLQQTKVMMKNLCKRSSGVSQDSLNQFKAQVFLDDPKLKCYFHCCLGMMKTMKKDKITVADATKQIELLLPEEMREASLKQLNGCKDAGKIQIASNRDGQTATSGYLFYRDRSNESNPWYRSFKRPCEDLYFGKDACDIAFNFVKCSAAIDSNNMLIPT